MTKLLGGLILGLFSMISLTGQTEIGVYTGLHSGNVQLDGLNGSLAPDTKGIKTALIGATVNFPLDDKLSLSSGFEYGQKGFDLEEMTDFDLLGLNVPIGVKAETRLNTIEIPLHLKYNFGNDKYGAYLLAGLNVTRASSGTIKTFASSFIDFGLTNTEIDFSSDRFNRTTYGGSIGAGASAKYGSGRFFGEITYKKDFTNYLYEQTINASLANKGYTMKIGYLIAI